MSYQILLLLHCGDPSNTTLHEHLDRLVYLLDVDVEVQIVHFIHQVITQSSSSFVSYVLISGDLSVLSSKTAIS